jgi:hypothetical protein
LRSSILSVFHSTSAGDLLCEIRFSESKLERRLCRNKRFAHLRIEPRFSLVRSNALHSHCAESDAQR